MRSTETLRAPFTQAAVHAAGAIRRMAVTLTSRALWQLTGFRMPDGKIETLPNAEPFLGFGFHARPPANGKPEAIVLMPHGDSKSVLVVAVRDEKTRQAIAGALSGDETAMFNSQAIVVVKADGTVEVRSKNGTAVPLLTFAEFMRHVHLAAGATSNTGTPIPVAPPALSGTDVIKGE